MLNVLGMDNVFEQHTSSAATGQASEVPLQRRDALPHSCIVRGYLLDAQISFDKETGGRELSGNYLIDNTRLVSEFGVQYRPYRERVLQIINDVRKEEGLPELAPH
jgi:hypothetical protein